MQLFESLSMLDRALLCRWSWRFVEEKGVLWKQVISRKFGVEGGGIPVKWGRGLEWGYGRRLGRKVLCWATILCFLWEMVEESDFGRINGAVMRLCVFLSHLCMAWQFQKWCGWRRFETLWLGGGRLESSFL